MTAGSGPATSSRMPLKGRSPRLPGQAWTLCGSNSRAQERADGHYSSGDQVHSDIHTSPHMVRRSRLTQTRLIDKRDCISEINKLLGDQQRVASATRTCARGSKTPPNAINTAEPISALPQSEEPRHLSGKHCPECCTHAAHRNRDPKRRAAPFQACRIWPRVGQCTAGARPIWVPMRIGHRRKRSTQTPANQSKEHDGGAGQGRNKTHLHRLACSTSTAVSGSPSRVIREPHCGDGLPRPASNRDDARA